MTARRTADFRLEEAIVDPGFSPRQKDAKELVELVARGGDLAEHAERSLLRLGHEAGRVAAERATRAGADEKARARLVAIVGKARADHGGDDLTAFLLGALSDPDARVRRFAANALGKVLDGATEPALAEALGREKDPSVRRALAEALGKIGGPHAIHALSMVDASDDELLARVKAKAALMIQRTAGRAEPSTFVLTKPAPSPLPVRLHCRRGLASFLLSELASDLAAEPPAKTDLASSVMVTLTGAPERLFQARTMLFFGFVLPKERLSASVDIVEALTRALTSEAARLVLSHFTEGPVRFRIDWVRGGKRRASVWRAAEEIQKRAPWLVNDPTESTWEVLVRENETTGEVDVELCPKVDDPRFAYRQGDVPAASHPTLAAALVRASSPRPDDVVWDPFCGSGIELCERALAGPFEKLIGSDLDTNAIEVARKNLTALPLMRASPFVVALGDARSFVPRGARPTLVITNPPMGRRVLRGEDLEAFLDRFLAHAAEVVCPGGRIAWIAPIPEQSDRMAARLGLTRSLSVLVDMGGFDARLEVLDVPLVPPVRTRPRRDRR